MSPEASLNCGNCRAPMRALRLAGHYGRAVEIDLCASCHLVWFDAIESARLSGLALLELVGQMANAQQLPHEPLKTDVRCPRCQGALKRVHNRSRWGRSLQLECLQQDGAFQSFAQFLAEKGLVRPLSSADRVRLLQGCHDFACVNCGGPIGANDGDCPWCTSVPGLFDVARLAQALDPEGASEGHAVHSTAAQSTSLHCLACASPSPPALACAQCGATLATPRLADAHRAVAALGPVLQAHAQRPAQHVVRRRMDQQAAGLQRQRDWARQMQAEADGEAGGERLRAEVPLSALGRSGWVALALLSALLWWLLG